LCRSQLQACSSQYRQVRLRDDTRRRRPLGRSFSGYCQAWTWWL